MDGGHGTPERRRFPQGGRRATDPRPTDFCIDTRLELGSLKVELGNLKVVVQRLVDAVQTLTVQHQKP